MFCFHFVNDFAPNRTQGPPVCLVYSFSSKVIPTQHHLSVAQNFQKQLMLLITPCLLPEYTRYILCITPCFSLPEISTHGCSLMCHKGLRNIHLKTFQTRGAWVAWPVEYLTSAPNFVYVLTPQKNHSVWGEAPGSRPYPKACLSCANHPAQSQISSAWRRIPQEETALCPCRPRAATRLLGASPISRALHNYSNSQS